MRVELHGVSKGRRGLALPLTTLAFDHSAPRIARAETEQRPTVLGLIASGRMKPDSGTVLIDGADDRGALRRRVSLVDAPDVSEPTPNVSVSGVTAEELMFAGRPSHPIAVRRWLEGAGFGALSRTPIADVSPRERIALLLELTALRTDVEGIVLVAPDRHGGDPFEWWSLVEDFAARGYAMLVIAGQSSGTVLAGRAESAEVVEQSVPDVRGEEGEFEVEPESDASADVVAEPEPPVGPVPESEPAPDPQPEPDPAPAAEPDAAPTTDSDSDSDSDEPARTPDKEAP